MNAFLLFRLRVMQRAAVVPDDVFSFLSQNSIMLWRNIHVFIKEKLLYHRSAVVTMRITFAVNDGR